MMNRWKKWLGEGGLRAERAMLHPVWIVALAVLVVNDHILKGSAASGWMTGKLSDFAGLIVAPVLLAALLRLRTRGGVLAASATTFVVFSAINLSPALAAIWDALASTVWPWHTTVDPTDLLAVPFAAVAIVALLPSMERVSKRKAEKLAQGALATVAAFASVATSQPPPECDDLSGNCGFVQETTLSSRVSLLNRTHELHVFRVSALRQDISVDCGELERNPATVLGRGAFTNATLWFVQSGQEIALTDGESGNWGTTNDAPGRDCHAVMVESETAPNIFVVWDEQFQARTYSFDADIPKDIPVASGTLVLDADYSNTPDGEVKPYRMRTNCGSRAENCNPETLEPLAEIPPGARYEWSSTGPNDGTFHHAIPADQFDRIFEPSPFCTTPGAGEGLEWTSPPVNSFRVSSLEEGLDGCHFVGWGSEGVQSDGGWWICAPFEAISALAPAEGEEVEVSVNNLTGGGSLYTGLKLEVFRRSVDGETTMLLDYRDIYVVRGFGLPGEIEFDYSIRPREGCDAEILECGTAVLPADVELLGYETTLRPGESTTIGTVVERQIHLVRASLNPIYDPACDDSMLAVSPPNGETPAYLETLVVRPQ